MLKNEKGMAMLFALFIGVIVTLLGITLSQASNADTLQVQRDADSAQAYYYAKSGVELAIGNIMKNGPDYLSGQDEPVTFYGGLGDTTFSSEPEDTPNYNIKFEIQRKNNDFIIKSTGIVRKGDAEGAQVASNAVGFTISCEKVFDNDNTGGGNGGSGQVPPLDMIFALGKIDLSDNNGNGGSSEIIGDAGTNSIAPNSVIFGYSTLIKNGDLYIGPGVEWDEDDVVVFPGNNGNGNGNGNGGYRGPETNIPDGEILNLSSPRDYPLPSFPELPDFGDEEVKKMDAGWNSIPPGGFRISQSGKYSNIEVKSHLTFDIGDEDLIIQTNNLSVTGSGQIKLNKTGSGRLILYVLNSFDLQGSSTINQNGSYDDIYMYYSGDQTIDVGGSTKFVGSIYALNSDVKIRGSGGIVGHIITGGDIVNLTGDASANTRVIYAPNATFNIQGSSSMRGALVAKEINMKGNARIYYDDSMDMNFLNQLWNTGEPVLTPNKSWWEAGQWVKQ
ncbi:hypothetical protein SAMN05660649_00046 [Desulfotomaculum arcticum]|uniref:DUF7305 domain-containing protein n=1 Tax=Desulfotruncus arcticus DSM 17038 TaxID=1121424 RepID=A0A1I2MQC0_9FIRM|nr:pilus assembly PilX N-terminal domain-containing protein [Desulfotruncus arcticus]SFF92889.1 hypothetical protein SAMN05660649_00046 [Desulfotomaculum arcticum] [Desulfotruncus arcticus DSM 17038]